MHMAPRRTHREHGSALSHLTLDRRQLIQLSQHFFRFGLRAVLCEDAPPEVKAALLDGGAGLIDSISGSDCWPTLDKGRENWCIALLKLEDIINNRI